MRLRETIFAEAADLREHMLGKLPGQPPREHAVDELSVKFVDHSRPPPGAHRTPQLVGFARRETGRHYRQPHRLFLEERHAERLFEHLADGVVGIGDGLLARPPPQVGVHHIPLDRPRPHDRHLDDEVVEAARPEPGQHAHLRPALDLENSHRIGPRDHLVNGRILGGNRGQRESRSARCRHQIECPADRRQHSQRQAVDLEDAQFVEVVLVPLHHRPARHRRRLDRHEIAEVAAGHHHPPDVLSQVTRKADELADERHEPRAGVTHGGEPRLGQSRRQILHAVPRVDHGGDGVHAVEREAQHLGDVADG